MRLVHFSDTHIGFQAYARVAPDGLNIREHDVEATFVRLIDAVIEVRPDVVVIAGDLFHAARPSNAAVLCAFSNLSRLAKALPASPIILAGGNHDLARSTRGASILQLFATLGIYVADRQSMRFGFDDLSLSVLAVPDAPGLGRPAFSPDARARYNVACIHGEAYGVKQTHADWRASLTDITPDEIGYDRWDYVAYGHFHCRETLGPRASYCGSPDFTSSNPWGEIATPKGFIERDLDSGAETFHVLEPGRRFVDVEPIYGQGLAPDELDRRIADALESAAIDDAVVRLKVLGVTREIERSLNQKALRSFQRRALALRLDFRRPVAAEAVSAAGVSLGRRRFSPIEEKVREMLGSDKREIPADVDRGELEKVALYYLKEAERREADSPAQAEPLTEQLTASLSTQESAA